MSLKGGRIRPVRFTQMVEIRASGQVAAVASSAPATVSILTAAWVSIAGIAGSVSRWVALEERLRWRGAVKTVRIS